MNEEPGKAEEHGGQHTMAGLAAMNPETMLSLKELAACMGFNVKTIRRMVARCELPEPIRMRRRNYWFAGRVHTWLEHRAELAERETERHLRKFHDFA